MKKHVSLRIYGGFLLLASIFCLANSGNPPGGNTGAPFNNSCGSCHNGGGYTGTVAITGLPTTIQPSTVYNLNLVVTATGGAPAGAGFQLVVVDGSSGAANCGDLANSNMQSGTEMLGGREYLEQRGAKSFSGSTASWAFTWTSPATVANNQVKFYYLGNIINGNSGTGGDVAITSNVTVPFAAGTAAITATATATPVSCNGGSNGSASVSATGGTGSFTYLWSNNQATSAISNLTAGTYTVTVTSGTATTTATASVTQPTALVASAIGGTISCANPAVSINGSASGGTAPYTWSWSNGATGSSISVSAGGTYTATVTDTRSCTRTTTATIAANTTAPTAVTGSAQNIMPGGTVNLNGSGSSTGAQYTYQWSTNNGIIQSGANTLTPTVSSAGTYTLLVTNTQNGCTSTATTQVNQAATIPVAEAGANFTVTCQTPLPVTLNGAGSSTGPEFTYFWSTSNGNVSSGANTLTPTITQAGTYNLVVTNVLSSATATDVVTVTYNTTAPQMNLSATNTITCAQPCATLNVSSSAGTTFVWRDASGAQIGTGSSISVCAVGVYTAVATATNGCTNTDQITVTGDSSVPTATVSPSAATLNCATPAVTLSGNGSNSSTWTGPNGFSVSNQASIQVNQPGTYTYTVTAANGCTAAATSIVSQDNSIPTASVNSTVSTLSCSAPSANLTCQTNAGAPVIYAWSGPNGFSGNTQTVTANAAGTYTVNVTGANGCTNSASIIISGSAAIPTVAISNGSGVLNCAQPNIQLVATGSSTDLSYAWEGPNGFSNTTNNPTVQTAGTYTVTATASNGCTATASTSLSSDFTAPTVTATGGQILCNTPGVSLNSTISALNGAFLWTGPNNFTSTEQNPTVNTPGTYTVVGTNPTNGCTSSATAVVTIDNTAPVVNVTTSNLLNCTLLNAEICATSSIGGTTFSWTGPNGAAGNLPCYVTNTPGTFTVTANAPNGCQTQTSISVIQDIAPPQLSVQPIVLTCYNPTASNLFSYVSSTTPGTTITIDSTVTPILVTATAPNGCTTTATMNVISDAAAPQVSATTSGVLTCSTNSVICTATSSIPGVTFEWSIGGTTSTITVTTAGTYTVTATNLANGCTSTSSVAVTQDVSIPACATATSGPLSCNNTSVSLTGASNTPGSTFNWFTSIGTPLPNPTVTQPGNYVLVVTAPNGCTSSCTATVGQVPALVATFSGVPNCDGTYSLSPMFSGGLAPYTFSVNGNPLALLPGNYTIVSSDASGCTSQSTVTLAAFAVLNASVTQVVNPTSGNNGAIQITVTNGVQPLTFAWTNQQGQTVSTVEDPTNLAPGTYQVVITDGNGCQKTLSNIQLMTIATNNPSIEQLAISIYPNPANNSFTLESMRKDVEISGLTILDQTGRIIKVSEENGQQIQVSSAELMSGVYTVRILVNNNLVVHKRIFVQH